MPGALSRYFSPVAGENGRFANLGVDVPFLVTAMRGEVQAYNPAGSVDETVTKDGRRPVAIFNLTICSGMAEVSGNT